MGAGDRGEVIAVQDAITLDVTRRGEKVRNREPAP